MRSLFSPDILAALCIGVAATFVSREAYRTIEAALPPTQFVIEDILEGNHTYQVRFQDSCVGNLETRLLVGQASVLNVAGTLLVHTRGIDIPISLSGHMFFNPLNQLAELSAFINSPVGKVTVTTQGVSEVTVSGNVELSGDTPHPLSLKLPGPFELRATGPDHYGITSALASFYSSFSSIQVPDQPRELSLQLGEPCKETGLNAARYIAKLPPAVQLMLGAVR